MAKKVNETLDLQSAARIINLPSPSAANEPATKAYADAIPAGLKFLEQPARVAATTNINTASPGATIDGVTLANGDRVLLAGQTTTSQNGTYVFNGSGSALTRTTDAFVTGSVIFTTGDGSSNGNVGWILTTDNPVVGTTALTFLAAFRVFAAGTGLTLSGNTFSLTSPVAVANGGTNATSTAAAKTSLGFPTTYETDFGDGAASSFTITHNLGNQYVNVVVVNKSTNAEEDCTIVHTSSSVVTLSSETWTATPPGSNAYHVACRG